MSFQRVIHAAEAGDPPYATTCIFCEQCLHLERAAVTGAGLLLWLPEISQADLNHLARAIYVARLDQGPMAELATRALDALTQRRSDAKKRLGSDDPMLLATILRESLNDNEIKVASKKLDGIRLLPSDKYMVRGAHGDSNRFPQIAKYWVSASGPFGAWPASKWHDMLQQALAKTGNA
jgi:intracellular multiplication protein IcmJ